MSFRKVSEAEMFDAKELPVYGMDLEIEKKRTAKKNVELEQSVKEWIKNVSGTDISNQDFADAFADGILLSNAVKPNCIPKVHTSKFMIQNNIVSFIQACGQIGIPKHDLFETWDITEKKNIDKVVMCVYLLGEQAKKLNKKLPAIRSVASLLDQSGVNGGAFYSTQTTTSSSSSSSSSGATKPPPATPSTTSSKPSTTSSTNSSGTLDDLEKLADLKRKGILTDAEFEAKKKQILGL